MRSIFLAAVVLLLAAPTFAVPARILIIRHGEKPADSSNPNLSPQGYQRAQILPTLFSKQPQLLTYGKPVALFAFNNSDGHSNRGVETATPLAGSLGLQLNTSYSPTQTSEIARLILGTPAFTAKMVMIVWRHSDIQNLAMALGVSNAPAWSASVFDRIWEIDLDPQGHVVSFKNLPQNLLPGDSANFYDVTIDQENLQ